MAKFKVGDIIVANPGRGNVYWSVFCVNEKNHTTISLDAYEAVDLDPIIFIDYSYQIVTDMFRI